MTDEELKVEILKQYKDDNFTNWSIEKQNSDELTPEKLLFIVDSLVSTGDLPDNYIKNYTNEGLVIFFG